MSKTRKAAYPARLRAWEAAELIRGMIGGRKKAAHAIKRTQSSIVTSRLIVLFIFYSLTHDSCIIAVFASGTVPCSS